MKLRRIGNTDRWEVVVELGADQSGRRRRARRRFQADGIDRKGQTL